MPTVSVVIPCFNGARYVAAAMDSVRDQTFTDWELVVVDDGSTDDSHEIARRAASGDSRITVVSQPNGGVARARMRGFEHTDQSAPYVIFLDADDMWYPDALEVLVERLERAPHACAVFGPEVVIDVEGRIDSGSAVPDTSALYKLVGGKIRLVEGASSVGLWDLAALCSITTPGQCLIRRAAMVENGCTFDSSLSPSEDWDMWLQLAQVAPIEHVDRPVLMYRRHDGNASSQWERMQLQRRSLYRKNAPLLKSYDERKFDVVYAFGMYGHDIVLCSRWARESWHAGQRRDAVRYRLRAFRYWVKYARLRTQLAVRRALSRGSTHSSR